MRARLLVICVLLWSALLPAQATPPALAAPLLQTAPDPGTTGPFAVSHTGYDGGNSYYTPAGWPTGVEMRARISYPTNLASGPFPLLVFLHGKHNSCAADVGATTTLTWPCPTGFHEIPSYLGYEYVADVLASNGFIVVSIAANGINAYDDDFSADGGMAARADLVIRHLQLWTAFNTTTTSTFGSLFTGRVNLNNVGLMGHSRGGEGVARAYLMNASLGSPFGIRAVFPLAPVDFNRPLINNVPLGILLPYCDGDVLDLQGVHFYDDARYNVANDSGAKYTFLVMGANHNYYNTHWTPGGYAGGFDDWNNRTDPHCNPNTAGNGRLSAAQQRGTAVALLSAFFRTHLKNETQFGPIVQGDAPPPASATTSAIKVSYHAPGSSSARRDINRWMTTGSLATNTLGGAASASNVVQYAVCGGEAPVSQFCLSSSTTSSFIREPHSGVSNFSSRRGPGPMTVQWTTTAASYVNAIPSGSRDVRSFTRLQFRASTVWGNSANPQGVPQDFRVILTDGQGQSASARVSDHSNALDYPPGTLTAILPKAVLNMARIPLSAFGALNFADIRTVEFRFDQRSTGWLLVSDLAFANAVPAPPPSVSGSSPGGALVGQGVIINGNNLAGATAVRFNGLNASSFTVTSGAQISAVVPTGATTGPITVITPGGTATSSGAFNVYTNTGRVGVQVGNLPGPVLSSTFTARPTCGPISSIQFGTPSVPFANASVNVAAPAGGPSGQTSGFTYTPPANTTTVTISIQRLVQSGSATVNPVRVTDGCGVWQTFVGGGPNAFN